MTDLQMQPVRLHPVPNTNGVATGEPVHGATPPTPTPTPSPSTFAVVLHDGGTRDYTADEVRERLANSTATEPVGDIRMCDVCGRGVHPSGWHPHTLSHLRLIGDAPPKAPSVKRGTRPHGNTPLRSGLSTEAVLACIVDAGAPILASDVCDRLGALSTRDRKAVSNRITQLLHSGAVHSAPAPSGNGTRKVYAAGAATPRRGRPPKSASSASRELEHVPSPPPARPVIDSADACTGLLMGMTGAESVPLTALPELMRWVDHTREIVRLVTDER